MEKDQVEEDINHPPEEGTNTNNDPKAPETPEREEIRQPHELPSADLPVTDSQNSSNDFKVKTEEERNVFTGNGIIQETAVNIEDMDTSELVSYLMSPLDIPVETMEDEAETFNCETILNEKMYQDDDEDIINFLDDEYFEIFDEESFDEG